MLVSSCIDKFIVYLSLQNYATDQEEKRICQSEMGLKLAVL